MRVIEEKIIDAIRLKKDFSSQGRDEVRFEGEDFTVRLHGNKIAEKEGDKLFLTDCGWATSTTASRINAVCKAMNVPLTYRYGQGGYFTTETGVHHARWVMYNLKTRTTVCDD